MDNYIVVQSISIEDVPEIIRRESLVRQYSAGITTLVNNKIKEGYIPQGGLLCMIEGHNPTKEYYSQPMVKRNIMI